MFPPVFIVTKATTDAWDHLAGVARAYQRTPDLEADRYARTIRETARGGDPVLGGTGADVALYGAQHTDSCVRHAGGWQHHGARALAQYPSQRAATALAACAHGDFDTFQALVSAWQHTDPRAIEEVLAALSTTTADADPDGTAPTALLLDATEPGPWRPRPRQLPEWRRRLLARGWGDALDQAALYYVDDGAGAVATRKASRPRRAPLTGNRVPCPAGLLVFAEQIHHAAGRRPLVAASWVLDDTGPAPGWRITLYGARFGTPPLEPTAAGRVTAGQVWDHEPPSGGDEFALRTVVACWDLITQGRIGAPVTTVTEEPRKPVRVRADRRRGITDNGTVRVVTIRGHAPVPDRTPAAARGAAGPGRRYDRGRWWVTEHSRSQCMNPALHAENGCIHEDITILEHPKGPPGKPFLDTVRVLRGHTLTPEGTP